MADQSQATDDLFGFAQALVKQLVKRYQLEWDEYRIEDAVQDLFLAGWQVWQDEGDVGLAKNWMASRQKNLLRDFSSELKHEPKSESDRFKSPSIGPSGELWDEDAVRAWDQPSSRADLRGDAAETAAVQDYLNHLPECQRRIVQLRMAGCTDREIAEELGIGLRTVERELSQIRKEHKDDED